MANLNIVLRQEIARIARKEARGETKQLKATSAAYRKAIAALKRRVAEQAREIAGLVRQSKKGPTASAAPEESSVRFRAGGVAAHRKRLGLSAEDFGRLAGVTGQTVYNWERGKRPRPAQLKALGAVRAMGRREAAARLAEIPRPPAGKRRVAKRGARGAKARRRR